ncbi:winged helix-turn-helix transcriptional regulator [Chitinophagaceae bacterium LWZ2-11]
MENKRKTKNFNPYNCGVTHFLNLIGGKWKIMIIYAVSKNCNRFSLLQKAIPQISKQMLINQLRELEEDKIIERKVYAEIPPKVEYKITPYGQSIMPIILVIQDWGQKDLKNIEAS